MSDTSDPDFLRRLEQAIAKLPRLQRAVFLAHRMDDMSYGEIARRTGLTATQVQRQMARAICNIDRQLEGEKLRWWHRWF